MHDEETGGLTRKEILTGLEKVNAFLADKDVQAAFEVAHVMGWNWNWLNDVKGFVSEAGESAREPMSLPEFSNLSVYTAAPDIFWR